MSIKVNPLAQVIARVYLAFSYQRGSLRRPVGKWAKALRRNWLKVGDPVVECDVGRFCLCMPLSHELLILRKVNPTYDTALPRICAWVRSVEARLSCIDVGANIGDTIALIASEVDGQFMAVEASDKFFALLEHNYRNHPNVQCVRAVCGENGGDSVSIVTHQGTGFVSKSEVGGTQTCSLDELLKRYTGFEGANVLKCDTDGYDYKVLRGAVGLLRRSQPVVYFELNPPELLRQHEQLLSIFPLFEAAGYKRCLLYDNVGFPVVEMELCERSQLKQLIAFISAKPHSYFDVLVIPERLSSGANEFIASEFSRLVAPKL